MNLIEDVWLPVIRASGEPDKIAPWQIAEKENPVIELNAPRPDFQGALYQFLIGLLQTCFAPEDNDEWLGYWNDPPDVEMLRTRFAKVAPAFELDNPGGPAFMQDFDLPQGETKAFSALLIDAPGGKTVRDNLDHFIKRGAVEKACLSCAATALFALQSNAPAGGQGHRVGLRGGGPLTTLVLPTSDGALWKKLWLNILDSEDFVYGIETPTAEVFPWMDATRTSEKGGFQTRPSDVHHLQMYWGMPRRIRLAFNSGDEQRCDLCGQAANTFATSYITKNFGVDYVGEWVHPLTPYRFDPKKEKPPLSIKGQKGGLGYRHWLGLVLANSNDGECAAKTTRVYMESRAREIDGQNHARLWCFGYDMDNMKARCWYEHTLPLLMLDQNQRENVFAWANELIAAAWDAASTLRSQVKAAWFRRPGDVNGDMNAVVQEFWQHSENDFYKLLEKLAVLPGDQRLPPPEIYSSWVKRLQSLSYELFDRWALESPAEDLDMKRIVSARNNLEKYLNGNKPMKTLFDRAGMGKGVKNAATEVSLP